MSMRTEFRPTHVQACAVIGRQRRLVLRHRIELDEPALTIVSGASSNHFAPLLNLLASCYAYEPFATVVVWDLGLTSNETACIRKLFPHVEQRVFAYDRYPAFMNININAGCYAWKPVIVHETAREFGGLVLWCDAGDLLRQHLRHVRRVLLNHGVFTPLGTGTVQRWTHPITLDAILPLRPYATSVSYTHL